MARKSDVKKKGSEELHQRWHDAMCRKVLYNGFLIDVFPNGQCFVNGRLFSDLAQAQAYLDQCRVCE